MAGSSRARRRPRRRHSWLWRYRRILFLFGLLAFTAVAGVAFVLSQVPLPAVDPPPQSTFLLAADGSRLATLQGPENRVNVKLAQVPDVLVDAVLATEDRQFFEHSGIDPIGIARATWNDIRGGRLQGGSTITQQYVKNRYVGRDRTLWRKLREAVVSVKLERELSKNEVLERYLNEVYFGRGAYGVQAAARVWFGKDVSGVGLREAAYLAGLIRAPEKADVAVNPETAEQRRRLSLRAMVATGDIAIDDAAEVEKQPIGTYVLAPGAAEPKIVAAEAGTEYFVSYVTKLLIDKYDVQDTFSGGLRVTTTLDVGAQKAAYSAVYGLLNRRTDPAGALVAVDDEGRVRAMVGGRDYATSKVNLAVGREGGGRGRQPGSTFKPFLLAEIVRRGYTVESSFPGPAQLVLPKANGGEDWPVHNYDDAGFGAMNLVDATRLSVNTVYAQAAVAVGPQALVKAARDLGVTAPLEPLASLVLGTKEVSPLDMASAYSTLARRGERIDPQIVLSVANADGKVIYKAPKHRRRVLEREDADVVNMALQQVVERGTGVGARWPAAGPGTLIGKTGTTQDYVDAWFVGATSSLTAAVWMGYPEGNAQTLERFRLGKVTGGSIPATIFKRFMSAATRGQKLVAFPALSRFPGEVLGGRGRSPFRPAPTTSSTAPGATAVITPTTRRPGGPSTTSAPVTSPPSTAPPATNTTAGPEPTP